jgi:hypothetical protein
MVRTSEGANDSGGCGGDCSYFCHAHRCGSGQFAPWGAQNKEE